MSLKTRYANVTIGKGKHDRYTTTGNGNSMKVTGTYGAFSIPEAITFSNIMVTRLKDTSGSYVKLDGKLSKYSSGADCWAKIGGSITVSFLDSENSSADVANSSSSLKICEPFFGTVTLKAGSYIVYETGSDGYPSSKQLTKFSLVRDIVVPECDTKTYTSKGVTYIKIETKLTVVERNAGAPKPGSGWLRINSNITVKKESNPKKYPTSEAFKIENAETSTILGDANVSADDPANFVSQAFDLTNGMSEKILESYDDLMMSSINGIFGVPYQWNALADRRIPGKNGSESFGRKYAEKIAARMPLLFLTPCRPAFLSGADDDQKNNFLAALNNIGGGGDEAKSFLDTFIGDVQDSGITKYYTTNFAYAEYYRYVNPMCQMTAKMLELDKDPITGKKGRTVLINNERVDLTEYSWAKALDTDFSSYWSASNAIPFYVNANVTISESVSNDTTKSSLDTMTESFSAQAKEIQFLLGTASSASDGGIVTTITDSIQDLLNSVRNDKSATNFLNNVAASMGSIAAGGSLMFPEIWSDSSMARSYNIDIKLRSPDADNLSIYLNILVPLYHLMALAAPQMMGNNYNAYSSPFLVKAYCRSAYNIDMGIITSMDVSKGKEGAWNANGLPTEIDVSLTIKDLYDTFCLTGYTDTLDLHAPFLTYLTGNLDQGSRILKNTAMMDYLCNNAGLNLNQNAAARTLTMYTLLRKDAIVTWPNNQWLKLQGLVDTKLKGLLGR